LLLAAVVAVAPMKAVAVVLVDLLSLQISL
jgi:hypothetical protein